MRSRKCRVAPLSAVRLGWLGAIYNGRIAPVAPYGICGAIWYQAESNCGKGEDPRDYRHKQRALVQGWRKAWNNENLPFFYVQLPQWRSYAWTYAREEQLQAMAVDGTGMAVTIDLDNANDIHPPNKIDVGERWPAGRWPKFMVRRYRSAARCFATPRCVMRRSWCVSIMPRMASWSGISRVWAKLSRPKTVL